VIFDFQEAEGWPGWVDTEKKRRKYIAELEKKENIFLHYNKVEKNPGKRALAKLILNSFCGKVCNFIV